MTEVSEQALTLARKLLEKRDEIVTLHNRLVCTSDRLKDSLDREIALLSLVKAIGDVVYGLTPFKVDKVRGLLEAYAKTLKEEE